MRAEHPRSGHVLLRFAMLLALVAHSIEPREARAEDDENASADSSRAEEIEHARQQLRERISRVRMKWTVVIVDRPDAPFEIADEDKPRRRIEFRWADDGRYFVHEFETESGLVGSRRAKCCDGADTWQASYPADDSEFERPKRVSWEKGSTGYWDVAPLPLLALGFDPQRTSRRQPNRALPTDTRISLRSSLQVLGEEMIDGERRVRCGEPEKHEEIRSSRYGWEILSSVRQVRTIKPNREVVRSRTEHTWNDFAEAEPGLWIPHRGRENRFDDKDPSFAIWTLDAIEINPELRDEDFRFQFGAQAPVHIGNTLNRLPDGKPPTAETPLPIPMPAVVEDDTDQWKWNLGLAAACLLAIFGLFRWRRRG